MMNSSHTHRWSTLHPDRVSGSPGGRGHPVSALNLSVCHCRLWGRVTTVTARHTSLWEHPWLTLIGQTAHTHQHKSKEWENVKRGCLRESCPQKKQVRMLLDVTFGQQDDGHPNEWQHHQDNQQGDADALPVSVSSDRSDVLHVKRRTLFQCLGVERCQVKQAKHTNRKTS